MKCSLVMWTTFVGIAFLFGVNGIKANIPDFLRECYSSPVITTRDNLLPFTVTTLISLIRKIEDSVTSDMRILAPAICHKYRFDGIERNPEVDWSPDVVPFSPTGTEFYLYQLLFEKLLPSTQPLPNNTLSYKEKCTLHAMLSLAVDPWDRNDNSDTCSKISKYSSSSYNWNSNGFRFPREISKLDDAEVFDPKVGPGIDPDTHRFPHPTNDNPQSGNFQQYASSYPQSQCPIESGVIYNKYGTLSPGIVLAGIATGLQPENVNVRNLFSAGSPRLTMRRPSPGGGRQPPFGQPSFPGRINSGSRGYPNSGRDTPSYGDPGYGPSYGSPSFGGPSYGGPSYSGNSIDNRYAATLSGALAEVSLLLGPTMDKRMALNSIVGMSGGWNDTAIPKYYFIREYTKNVLSDPKIRGSIDGLILANEVKRWSDSASGSLKLSQVLGMYYSDKGLFGTSTKACNRRNQITELAQEADLKENSFAFALVLQDNLPSSVSIQPDGISRYVSTATEQALNYIGSSMSERCADDSTISYNPSPAVDLHMVIDASYDYKDISKIVTYIVDNMEINKYSSNFSLINGNDGFVLADSVQTPLEVYGNFTFSNYTSLSRGFNFDKLLSSLRIRLQNKMAYDQLTNSGGGNARVVLFVPQASANINSKDYLIDKIKQLRVKVPDVTFIYLVNGQKEKFTPFAQEPDKDVFTLAVFNDISQTLDPVIKRIAAVPKRIINPRCGPYWSDASYNSVTIRGYLEKPEVHYYRVHPNYYYKNANAKITIRNDDHSQILTVCSSRKVSNPIANSTRTSGDVNCKQLTGNLYHDIYISSNDCPDSYATRCDPYYISVSTDRGNAAQLSVSCTDAACEYPDMIKYSIEHQGLTCYSGAARLFGAPLLIILVYLINLW